jgi:hypothetical protein
MTLQAGINNSGIADLWYYLLFPDRFAIDESSELETFFDGSDCYSDHD